jgi:hypothetical protein
MPPFDAQPGSKANQGIHRGDWQAGDSISRRLSDLPSEIIKQLFQKAVSELGTRIGFQKLNQELGRLALSGNGIPSR